MRRLVGEAGLFDAVDHTDHREGLAVGTGLRTLEQLPAQRARVGPITAGEIFVDHADTFVAPRIGCGEEPSGEQPKAHGAKIVSTHAV